jgi:hypothetical protein
MVRFGNTEEAVFAFDALLAQQPNWIPALTERANLLDRLGRNAEADRDRERARRMNPNAAAFYASREGSAMLNFIALYPQDWFNEYYRGEGQYIASYPTDPSLQLYRERQLRQLESVPANDATIDLLYRKSRGEKELLNGSYNGTVDQQSRQWQDLMLGNLALLRQDFFTAMQYYNDAELSGARWPELYYNRGLTNILLSNYVAGCADLRTSAAAGFLPGRTMLTSLCSF